MYPILPHFKKSSASVSRPTILSATMSANFDALPNELILFIFKRLHIQDLVSCRSVCKRFMLLCHEVKIAQLQISNIIENVKYHSIHTHTQFNHKDAIDVRRFTTFKSWFRLGEFLKRLHFKGDISDFNELHLDELTQLEELRICFEKHYSEYLEEIILNLPNLKVLEIYGDSDGYDFHLTTPQLKILKCGNFESVHVADLSTIERLELGYSGENFHLMENVEILKIKTTAFDTIGSSLNLSVFPKLKILVCMRLDGSNLDNLFGLKLRKPELKIYFESVELIDSRKIDEYDLNRHLDFQINNYDLLCDKISDRHPLDYNELMRLVGGTLPNDFYKKYGNFEEVTASGDVENQNHLLQFLNRFDYMKRLEFYDTDLDQNFFDGLEIEQLTYLIMEDCPIVNYDFLFKLKVLNFFFTDSDSDLFDLSFQLFRRLKYLTETAFRFNGEHVSMCKHDRMDRTEYTFTNFQNIMQGVRYNATFDHLDQLVHAVSAYKIQKWNSSNKSD